MSVKCWLLIFHRDYFITVSEFIELIILVYYLGYKEFTYLYHKIKNPNQDFR